MFETRMRAARRQEFVASYKLPAGVGRSSNANLETRLTLALLAGAFING